LKKYYLVFSLFLAFIGASSCKHAAIKLYNVDPDRGLVGTAETLPLNDPRLQCLELPDGHRECPYVAASWDDFRTVIENCVKKD
jgi:hypothetical protein